MSGLFQLEVLREQLKRSDHKLQQLLIIHANKDRNVQDARLVGLLGRDNNLRPHDKHVIKLDVDVQDARLVRVQGPYDHHFRIFDHCHNTFSCARAYYNNTLHLPYKHGHEHL